MGFEWNYLLVIFGGDGLFFMFAFHHAERAAGL
jgi:hypothetical protein